SRDWSSDVCSSDLERAGGQVRRRGCVLCHLGERGAVLVEVRILRRGSLAGLLPGVRIRRRGWRATARRPAACCGCGRPAAALTGVVAGACVVVARVRDDQRLGGLERVADAARGEPVRERACLVLEVAEVLRERAPVVLVLRVLGCLRGGVALLAAPAAVAGIALAARARVLHPQVLRGDRQAAV